MIRIGIIGCGSIAEFRHLPEYASNPNVEIAYLYNPRLERAERLAQKFGGRAVDDYMDIMEDPGIDAISDCTPNHMHHKITTTALRHGKHVLCEKPMGVTLEEAEDMVRTARERGKILMVAHNQRLAAAHVKAKEILKSGKLGRVLTFSTTFGHGGPEQWSADKTKSTWFFNKESSVIGVAGDLGIHKIDLIRYLLEDEITEVSAIGGTLDKRDEEGNPIGVVDNMLCLMRTGKGAMGTAAFSWTYYGQEDNSTTLYCEKGIMKIYGHPEHHIIITKSNGEEIFLNSGEIQANDNQTGSGVIDAFVDCIINKKEPLISGEEGLKSMKVILAAIESAREGRVVRIY